jgi:large subunit ribosomal protein L23
MRNRYEVIKRPLITEKGLAAKESLRTLVFEVAPDATKVEIREAVQAVFKVKVAGVRTALLHGKERRRGRLVGRRPDWKKAYVTLQPGEKMPEYAENV